MSPCFPAVLSWLLAAAPCPLETDLGALPSAPPTTRDAPRDLTTELASRYAAVVPGSVFGPVDLGDHGAVVAAVRCAQPRAMAGCHIVVAHLAPVSGSGLVLSGVVGTLPLRRTRGATVAITGVALHDIVDSPTPELIVTWNVGADRYLGALAWLGLSKVLSPEPVPAACRLLARCDAESRRQLERGCPDGSITTWRWDPHLQQATRVR